MTDTVRYRECPACDQPVETARRLFTAALFGDSVDILQCGRCGLVFKGWFRTIESVGDLYPADYVHFTSAEAGLPEVNSARQKLARCRKLLGVEGSTGLRLLDVGCGGGSFVAIARQLGYDAEGIDPHLPASAETGNLRRATPDELEAHAYDIIVLLNVAEHLPRPKPFFASVRRLLKPRGVMLLTCPFGDSLARRFHRERWTHLALDEHVLFWTPHSLLAMLRPLGFNGETSVRVAGSPIPYGRIAASRAAMACPATESRADPPSRPTIQDTVWGFARKIQGHETLANLVRSVVHLTRTGDYLEFAIASRESDVPGR